MAGTETRIHSAPISRLLTSATNLSLANTLIAQLAKCMEDVAELFFSWNRARLGVNSRKDFKFLYSAIDSTFQAFQKTVEIVEDGSRVGVQVSSKAVGLVEQLLDKRAPSEDMGILAAHLLKDIDRLRKTAVGLKKNLEDILKVFSGSKEQETSLGAALMDYRNARVPRWKRFCAVVVPPVNSRARAFRDAADPVKRAAASAMYLNMLKSTQQGLDSAIETTAGLLAVWNKIYSAFQHISLDGLASKREILELHQRQWSEIQDQYGACASRALTVRGRLQIKDATKATLPLGAAVGKPW